MKEEGGIKMPCLALFLLLSSNRLFSPNQRARADWGENLPFDLFLCYIRTRTRGAEKNTLPGARAMHPPRREFIKLAGVSAAVSAPGRGLPAIAGPFSADDTIDHFVPADKKLKPEWIEALTAKGERAVYRGKDLQAIGMPVGGICAGQLYLTGDGRLGHWDIFNVKTPGYGYQVDAKPGHPRNVGPDRQVGPPVEQGFAIRVTRGGGERRLPGR